MRVTANVQRFYRPMLNPIFQRFAKKSPLCVMAAVLLARVFAADKLDRLFEQAAERQYTQDLLFSTVFSLMSKVVCAIEPSVHAAYQASREEIDVSITSVYNKLNALETGISASLVRYSAQAMEPIVRELGAELPAWLEGFRTKIVDGSCIEASEHRIEELRREAAGALPGKALAVFDPELKLVTDVFLCEDGHAQERRLFGQVLLTAQAGELWIADRNFCTRGFLFGLDERKARFIIREHALLPWEPAGPEQPAGQVDSGTLYEQPIRIRYEGHELLVRRIRLVLDKPTRDGDTEIHILTTLTPDEASAAVVAELYGRRWNIEHAFQELAEHLHAEVSTLGYPKAALFGFSVGFVAYNTMSVLGAALRSVHGSRKIEEEVSGYYIALELSKTYQGMMIAIAPEEWTVFADSTTAEIAALLRELAGNARLARYRKHGRGPKKPPPKRHSDKRRPHVSTAKLLAQRKS